MQHSAKQEALQATDECVMCGLCLPHCPTYHIASNEAESPRGRITLVRALLEEKIDNSENLANHLDNCLTCLNCQSACPANVEYEKIIDMGRELTANNHTSSYKLKQFFLLFALSHSSTRNCIKYIFKIFRSTGITRLLKKAGNKIPVLTLLPTQAEFDFTHSATAITDKQTAPAKIVLLNSCASELFSDSTKTAAEYLLKKLDCEIVTSQQGQCCGALHQHTGHSQTATKLIQKLSSSLATKDYDAIISLATGCGAHINRYPKLLNNSAIKTLHAKHSDVCEFVLQLLEQQQPAFKPLTATVLVHNSCTQKQVTDDEEITTKLLRKIPQLELQQLSDKASCCGAGGMNLINQADIAVELVKNLTQTSINPAKPPAYLVSSNIGCALHFKSYFERQGMNITVCHPINLLALQLL